MDTHPSLKALMTHFSAHNIHTPSSTLSPHSVEINFCFFCTLPPSIYYIISALLMATLLIAKVSESSPFLYCQASPKDALPHAHQPRHTGRHCKGILGQSGVPQEQAQCRNHHHVMLRCMYSLGLLFPAGPVFTGVHNAKALLVVCYTINLNGLSGCSTNDNDCHGLT